MKFLRKLIISWILFINTTTFSFSANFYNVNTLENLNLLANTKKPITVNINNQLILNEDKKYPKNISFNFSKNGSFFIDKDHKLEIEGPIKSNKKIFYFKNNQDIKNLYLNNSNFFDVRWFEKIRKGERFEISQKYSSFHNKTMYFDNFKIDDDLGFTTSNIRAYFNNTILTGTFHFSEQNNCNQNTILKNIVIQGTINIYGRLGGYCGQDISINNVNLLNNENYRPAGLHIYSNIKNLSINKIFIEDSIRHYAIGIDSNSLDGMPENIYINEVYIKNSFVHGAFINGKNINIGKLTINSFGNIRKSNFLNTLHRGLNFPYYFRYLDLFENSPKGLIIGYGSNIKIDNVLIKIKNYSIIDFPEYFRIKKFLLQPSIFFVDLTSSAKIENLKLEIPLSIELTNKVIKFTRKIILKIINKTNQTEYRINDEISNIWPFEFKIEN